MKKSSLIVMGIFLTLTFTGCTRGSSTSNAVNKPSQTVSDNAEAESLTENTTEEQTTEALVEKPTIVETEAEYNAEEAKKAFEESDIPDSIKNIFLSDGKFIDTQTQKEMKLSEYILYEIIYSYGEDYNAEEETRDEENECGVAEWCSYVIVDFDNDGKKELFYAFQPEISFHQGVIFHEHTDGKAYAYRHPSLRVNVSKDGDVLASAGAMYPSYLLRYGFDTEKIIETKITDHERQDNGEFKYYADGHEVDQAEYGTYLEHFWEKRLDWTEFRVTPDSDEN